MMSLMLTQPATWTSQSSELVNLEPQLHWYVEPCRNIFFPRL